MDAPLTAEDMRAGLEKFLLEPLEKPVFFFCCKKHFKMYLETELESTRESR